ncbi:PTS mannitol transporter subunit IICBA [Gulosibacter sp. 10]|uniref:PTS mannitol transporter subunit IICBA n=1 Tax=Gulosibacter sp. 10 TaxID=1255570 RepID=UPI00097F1D26|nr:PTS mannitol transporter subunit IICBA [Gulosibacter sp. 10]SJM58433.1 PTS system, mannitol-specific IIB component / PTS system, mannitol-specific IIC component [Gulosibacter sp. 10]
MADTATTTEDAGRGGFRVAIQKFGTFLSGMIMPNIPALIAWGIITAFFIPDGWTPNEGLAKLVDPTIHYLLPLLIANTGGRMVYEARGGVVGTVATVGAIVGSDHLVDLFNETLPAGADALPYTHMFIGAMILGPLGAWVMKQLDKLWEGKIRAGFEMLVNMFSAGIVAFGMALVGFFAIARVVNWLMDVLGAAVGWLIETGWLPLVSVIIEPAKVFFLNNAINHGVLTPLGTQMSAADGKSILYLLEANPGPGLGILLAFTIFGVGAARATAPGAAIIHFFGGIHEIYFPYVLMKPALLVAVIAGGATGVATNMLFDAGLRAPASPGSIIAIMAQTANDSYLGVILSVVLSTAVSFLIAAVILRASRKNDLENEDALAEAVAKTEANKGKKSDALSGLSGAAGGATATATATRTVEKIVFACDAGMGSSAMGANVMRKKIRQAGIEGVDVTNLAIANLDPSADLVITQKELTSRAEGKNPDSIHVSVDNFMNSPRYDEVVDLLLAQREGGAPAAAEPAPAAQAPAAEPVAAEPAAAEAGPSVLVPERVFAESPITDRDEAIREAGRQLVASGAVTQAYADSMFDREETVSTYMGNLLAIPHGTNEAKDEVSDSALVFIRTAQPIDWNGNEVRFVVGIAGKDGGHIDILSKIATIFSDEAKVEQLLAAPDAEALYALLGKVNE